MGNGGDGSSLVRWVFRFGRWTGGGRAGFAFLPLGGLRLYVSSLLPADVVGHLNVSDNVEEDRDDDIVEEGMTHQHLALGNR